MLTFTLHKRQKYRGEL